MQPKLLKNARKETLTKIENISEGPQNAKWNDMSTQVFLKVCDEEIEADNQPHILKNGGLIIIEKFYKQTGKN